jgi:hypothetical protein
MHARPRPSARCLARCGPVAGTVARRGGFLADGVISLLVLGLILGAGLPLLAWTVRMQRTLERRQLALLTVANTLDAQTALPVAALTRGEPQELPLNDTVRAELPEAVLVRQVTETDPPGTRRVVVALRWRDFRGTTTQEVSLTGWVLE